MTPRASHSEFSLRITRCAGRAVVPTLALSLGALPASKPPLAAGAWLDSLALAGVIARTPVRRRATVHGHPTLGA